MSTDYMSGMTISDHDITLAIPGEVANVRARLMDALQKVGYKILGEQPLYAKRSSQGSACYDCSLNALDYPTTVTIALKQMNDVAVVAIFNFEVKSYIRMTKGDRQSLVREAEAIAALAMDRLAVSACRACGTQVTDESHFCRRCGAPLVFDVPELEVMRLTRNARGSYHNIVVGLLLLFLALLTVLPIFIVNGKAIWMPFFAVGIPLGAYSLFLLLQGLWQLHRTLNPKTTAKTSASVPAQLFASSITTALPPAPLNMSVTEATTGLLLPNRDRREKEAVPRKDHDTAEFDTDRLM